MGNFYVNYTIRGVSQADAAAAMAGRRAIIPPALGDAVVIFDKASDKQDEAVISKLAGKLSVELSKPVLAVLNHDDDILWYQLLVTGQIADQYNSCPDYFTFAGRGKAKGPTGGNAERLCAAFGSDQAARVEQILRKPDGYVFEFERHADLVEALHLPTFAVGASFNTFAEYPPEELPPGDVVRTQ